MENNTSRWYWPRRFALKMGRHLDSPETKLIYNEQIFTEIAPRYDFITRALSFWQDSSWKRDLVAALPARQRPYCLDLACGTGRWLKWVVLFVLIDVAVGVLAYSPIAGELAVRLSLEGGALVFSVVNLAVMLARRIRSPLMKIFGISVTSFALSSLAFILARPWNHLWWLAHAIFAAGFFLLEVDEPAL